MTFSTSVCTEVVRDEMQFMNHLVLGRSTLQSCSINGRHIMQAMKVRFVRSVNHRNADIFISRLFVANLLYEEITICIEAYSLLKCKRRFVR